MIAAGAGPGNLPLVQVFDRFSGQVRFAFYGYDPGFRGGVWVAAAEVDGDGPEEVFAAAGSGGGPRVDGLDWPTGAAEDDFFAFDPGFLGGVAVAAALR